MADINVHVGCHGVFEDAARTIKKIAGASPEVQEPNLITNRQYRMNWRAACLSGEPDAIIAAQSGPLMNSIREAEATLHVLSNTRILGEDNSIVEKRQLYPQAGYRVSNLIRILHGCDVHLKIFICDTETFEHRNGILPGLLRGITPTPWADLIHRVVAGAPRTPIHVFALSDAIRFAHSLPEVLFEPPVEKNESVEEAVNELIDNWWDLGIDSPVSDKDHYNRDLSAIASMDGVHLSIL